MMVEFDREEIEEMISKPHGWRTMFIILLILVILGVIGIILLFQQYQETMTQQKMKLVNESLILGYEKGKSECVVCPATTVCESTNITVQNIAVEQTKSGNMILYNGTHVVSVPVREVCARLPNATQ